MDVETGDKLRHLGTLLDLRPDAAKEIKRCIASRKPIVAKGVIFDIAVQRNALRQWELRNIIYVAQKELQEIRVKVEEGKEISRDDIYRLTHVNDMPDDELLVPVDKRGMDYTFDNPPTRVDRRFNSVDSMLNFFGCEHMAHAFLKARNYFEVAAARLPWTVHVTRTLDCLQIVCTGVSGTEVCSFNLGLESTFADLWNKLDAHAHGRVALLLPCGVDISCLKWSYAVQSFNELTFATISSNERKFDNREPWQWLPKSAAEIRQAATRHVNGEEVGDEEEDADSEEECSLDEDDEGEVEDQEESDKKEESEEEQDEEVRGLHDRKEPGQEEMH